MVVYIFTINSLLSSPSLEFHLSLFFSLPIPHASTWLSQHNLPIIITSLMLSILSLQLNSSFVGEVSLPKAVHTHITDITEAIFGTHPFLYIIILKTQISLIHSQSSYKTGI